MVYLTTMHEITEKLCHQTFPCFLPFLFDKNTEKFYLHWFKKDIHCFNVPKHLKQSRYHHYCQESDLPSFHWLFFEHRLFAFLYSLARLLLVEHDFSIPTSDTNIVGCYNIPAQYY